LERMDLEGRYSISILSLRNEFRRMDSGLR
jgi:hypothetical protein